MTRIDFHCKNMEDKSEYFRGTWFCKKRGGFFTDISRFCYDCSFYKQKMKEIVEALEKYWED